MVHLFRGRGSLLLAALASLVALAMCGCASTTDRTGSSMMGGATSTAQSFGPRMSGDVSGYHFSPLSCQAPASLPGGVVTVLLGDMGMTQMMGGPAPRGVHMMLRATPATVSAGQVSLVAQNMGWRTHELVVLPLAAGASAGQRVPGADGKVDETGSLGEASRSCADGAGEGITARSVGWTTVTLKPGRYELVCNLANHYADGMWAELDAT